MVKRKVFNAAAVVIGFVLLMLIFSHYFSAEEETLSYSGVNVYRAVYAYQTMEEQGFLVDLEAKGKWVDDGSSFRGSGLVLEADKGRFTVLQNRREITIGGASSASDDIAADNIILRPKSEAVVKVGIVPIEDNTLASFTYRMNALARIFVDARNIQGVGIQAEIMVDTDDVLNPTLIQKLYNVMGTHNTIALYDNGFQLVMERATLEELNHIDDILFTSGINYEKVATGRITLLIRSTKDIEDSLGDLWEKLPADYDATMLKIINEPL